MSEARDSGKNLAGALGPFKRARRLIVGAGKLRNRTFQLADAAMRSTANLLVGKLRKPTLR
jgi:hypothetical protein